MGYRDDLQAARARIAALEGDLAAEQERSRHLEAQLAGRAPERPPVAEPSPRVNLVSDALATRRRRVHYHPPASYLPMLRLCAAAARASWRRSPRAGATQTSSDSVVRWVLGQLRVPLTYLVWLPLYWLTFLVVFPLAVLVSMLLTPLLVPALVASRLSFAPTAPEPSGWFHGHASDSDGAGLLFIVSILMMPLTLPFVLALELGDD